MKKLLLTLTIALLATPSLLALPTLQLYIEGATYDKASESWVTYDRSFNLYVIGMGVHDSVMVSMSLMDLEQSDYPSGAAIDVDGLSYPTTAWTWGYAPISNIPSVWDGGATDLPKHDVFPSWFTEFNAGPFTEVGGIGNTVYDSAIANNEPFWDPATEGYIQSNHMGEYKVFEIDVNGGGAVHFDAYTLNDDGTIEYFAPFSHDATAAIPEPMTLLLFGTGLAGMGIVRRLRKR